MDSGQAVLAAQALLIDLRTQLDWFRVHVGLRWDRPTWWEIDNRVMGLYDLCGTLHDALAEAEINRALAGTATASSSYGGTTPAQAIDANVGTRWSSDFADNQWLQVDLGAPYRIAHARLFWEPAYARSWRLEYWNGAEWTAVYLNDNGAGGVEEVFLDPIWPPAQLWRMYGVTRATEWGFSLCEFELYGEPA
jgi:hypothetical protein